MVHKPEKSFFTKNKQTNKQHKSEIEKKKSQNMHKHTVTCGGNIETRLKKKNKTYLFQSLGYKFFIRWRFKRAKK